MESRQLISDVERLRRSLSNFPEAMVKPPFVVVSGLPGTGKSFFSRKLAERHPFLVLESDALRKVLFPTPTYNGEENMRLFLACHQLIEELLKKGIPLILDATSLSEKHRERLYHIVDTTGARLIIVRVEAPPSVVYERLEARAKGINPEDKSEADWTVYKRMRQSVEKIKRNHFAVDTSRDITPVIEKIVRVLQH